MCINTVLNMATNRVVKIIAGDIVEAHRAGVEAYNAIYRVTFENPADATITSAYHLDRCMDHGMKALALADLVTKIGGPIVLVGRFEKDADRLNRGDPMFDLMKAKVASSEIRGMVTKGDIRVKIASVPSILLSYSIIKEKHPLVLVSEGWSRQHAESVGFEHAETVDGAYRRILKRAERSKINVITMGNAMVPAFRL